MKFVEIGDLTINIGRIAYVKRTLMDADAESFGETAKILRAEIFFWGDKPAASIILWGDSARSLLANLPSSELVSTEAVV